MIRPIGFLENVWPLSVGLARSERRKAMAEAGGRLVLRDGKILHPWIAPDSTEPFPHLRQAINQANKILLMEEWELQHITLEELEPGSAFAWQIGGPEIEAHCAIVTNPQAVLLCGQSAPQIPAVHVPVGHIVACEPHTWRSAINGGKTTRLHLVMALQKRGENQ